MPILMSVNHPPPVLVFLEGVGTDSSQPARISPANPGLLPLHPLDLGITRGDGIFESISVIDGHALELEAHMIRLMRSAEMLDLPTLRPEVIADGIDMAVARHTPVPEILVKVFVTRGLEHCPEPTAWVYATEGPDYSQARSNGIAVITLNRGYPRNITATAPWLLQGAKTLSYAVNRSALREAARRDAQDAIFLSSDGYVLEGPASTVILRDATGYRSPAADDGVLPGTTQARIFAELNAAGASARTGSVREEELRDAQAIWLVSSGRMVVPVNRLDGVPREVDHAVTNQMMASLKAGR